MSEPSLNAEKVGQPTGHWEWRYAESSQGDAPPSRYAVEAAWVEDVSHIGRNETDS